MHSALYAIDSTFAGALNWDYDTSKFSNLEEICLEGMVLDGLVDKVVNALGLNIDEINHDEHHGTMNRDKVRNMVSALLHQIGEDKEQTQLYLEFTTKEGVWQKIASPNPWVLYTYYLVGIPEPEVATTTQAPVQQKASHFNAVTSPAYLVGAGKRKEEKMFAEVDRDIV
jgi:hypothetical protein